MSLDKSESKVQIDHLHPKHFHAVKRLRKSVQYILRYSSKYASFFSRVISDVHKALSTLELLDRISRNSRVTRHGTIRYGAVRVASSHRAKAGGASWTCRAVARRIRCGITLSLRCRLNALCSTALALTESSLMHFHNSWIACVELSQVFFYRNIRRLCMQTS